MQCTDKAVSGQLPPPPNIHPPPDKASVVVIRDKEAKFCLSFWRSADGTTFSEGQRTCAVTRSDITAAVAGMLDSSSFGGLAAAQQFRAESGWTQDADCEDDLKLRVIKKL